MDMTTRRGLSIEAGGIIGRKKLLSFVCVREREKSKIITVRGLRLLPGENEVLGQKSAGAGVIQNNQLKSNSRPQTAATMRKRKKKIEQARANFLRYPFRFVKPLFDSEKLGNLEVGQKELDKISEVMYRVGKG